MTRDRWAALFILLAAVALNLAVLWPEAAVETPTLNDGTLHLALVGRAVEALERGEDPTDPWVPYFVQGYPLFHHYQHLPHVATALLFKLLGGAVPLLTLFNAIRLLLLSTFPVSIYWAGRRLGVGAVPAALAGLVGPLLATNGLYGLDWASYVWRGYGLYTQLWGMWLLPPALAGLYVTLRDGRAYAGTAALMAAVLLSHTVLGYAALLSGGLFLFLGGGVGTWRRLGRLLLVGALVAAAAAYFLAPFGLDRAYMNRSVWEDVGKYDAYGWEWTLGALARGELLDYGRLPTLTLLAGLGLGVCLARWRRDERCRLIVSFSIFWLLLYFGRPTWGVLLELLPMSGDLHLHRLIALFHLGAIGLAGVGAAWLLGQAARGLAGRRQAWRLAAAPALAVLLVPAYVERVDYAAVNGQWLRESAAAFEADGGQLERLLAELATRPRARVYAGRGANWGKDYTLGSVPVYALLAARRFDSPGYLYHALALNADVEGYLDEARPATFNLFNLRYVVAPEGHDGEPPAGARLVAAYGRHRLYEVETSGYFDLVDSDATFYGPRGDWFEAARAWLQSGLVEARQHPRMVVGSRPAGAPGITGGAGEQPVVPLSLVPQLIDGLDVPRRESCGRLLAEDVAGNHYYAELQAERDCWLLLKAGFHPGWAAEVDGGPAEISMLAPSFVGVPVAAGHHQVLLSYRPSAARRALLVAGLAVLLLAAAVEWRRPVLGGRLAALRRAASTVGSLAAGRARSMAGRWPVAVVLGVVLVAGLPTLQLKQMAGHDAFEYVPRTIEFYRGLSEGHVVPRWAPDLSSGYGQPFFIFNPPLVYYAASAFHALGASVVAALNLACLALLAVAGLGMYRYGREFFGRLGGVVAGAAYVLAPFTLVNLYVRQALADFAAMAFIPWALWGLYRWVGGPGRARPVRYLAVGAVATALILLSSNPVALVAVPALALYVGWTAWRARGAGPWRALGRGALALGLGMGLAAYFWLPALAERDWVQTRNLLAGYLNYRHHFVYLHQLFVSPWGYGLSTAGTEDGMSFALGPAHLALLAASLLLAWRRRRANGEGRPDGGQGGRDARVATDHLWFFVALLGLAAFLVTDNSIWLWDGLPLLQYLEFPWRILVLAAVATSFVAAFPFVALRGRRREWLAAAVLGALLVAGLARAKPEGYYQTTDAEFAPAVIAARGIEVTTTREYEPIWVQTRPAEPAPADRLILVGGEVRVLKSDVAGSRYEWLIEAGGPAQLRVAAFYFPGWHLEVDGRRRPVTMQNRYGLIDVALEAGVHEVVVEFGSTALRGWALVVSLAAAGVLVALAARPLVARRRGRARAAEIKDSGPAAIGA